jgi:outer membrane protein assembly factor BamD
MNRATPLRLLAASALALLSGCGTLSSLNPFGGGGEKKAVVDPSTIPATQLYNNGVDALEGQRYKVAITQFDLVQENYPYSPWATNAMLMQGYSEYLVGQYSNAISTLDHFIQLHPTHHDIAYAYYLRALSFYEQIEDVQRDQKSTVEAMGALREVVNRFPDSAYARDARLKIDLCNDHLAGHEMAIGRWYESQHLYTAAIGRFQRVVDDFQTTNHVPEALHRLVEIYLKLGLVTEARRTAAVLGYNYPGSSWYSTSYRNLVRDGDVRTASGRQQPVRTGNGGLLSDMFGWAF